MKIPTIPASWHRPLIWSILAVVLVVGVVYAVPQMSSAVVNWALAGREGALRKEIEKKIQPQIDKANKEQAAAKLEADAWRKRSAVLGSQVAKLTKERAAIQSQVQQAGAAVQVAREDAAHVAEIDLRPRIRASLARLRAGAGG